MKTLTNSHVFLSIPGERRGLVARLLAIAAMSTETEARIQRNHDPASDRVRRLMDDADWLADTAALVRPER
jgi:hypothetical protein